MANRINEQNTLKKTDPDKRNHFESNKKYFTICIYTLFVIAIGAIIVYLIMNLKDTKRGITHLIDVLSPFLIAFFIAFLLNPIVLKLNTFFQDICKLKSHKLCKFLSILFSYLLVLGVLTITLFYVIPQIADSISDLTKNLPAMYNGIIDYLKTLEEKFPNLDFQVIEKNITDSLPQLVNFGTNFVTKVVSVSFSIVKVLINIVLSVVISCYMLSDKKLLITNTKRFLYAVLPIQKASALCQTAKECNTIFSSFIIGKSIDSLIIGIICFILMSILQLPYSILISVVIGITNMIPYFGPFIGAIPGVLIYLFIKPVDAIIFAAMIFLLQQFDGLYLGPKILGESTGLKPLWVIFAITIGGAYFGVLGMFLGVPIIAVISYLLNKFVSQKLKKRNLSDKF